MTEKNEALRLADALEISSNHHMRREAAAELRRLHAQRDALLEALKELMVAADGVNAGPQTWLTRARAAIKAAEELRASAVALRSLHTQKETECLRKRLRRT